jgi:hypothetical protein
VNDRHDDDQSDADWLAAQFGATGAVPTPEKKPKAPEPDEPAEAPTLVNPFGAPGTMPPPAGPGAAFPPPPAADDSWRPPAPSWQNPQPPAAQPPTPPAPPASPAPFAAPSPPAPQPPAASGQPVVPPPGPADSAPGFAWGLAPGGDAAAPPPAVPPVVPPVASPVIPPVVPPVIPPVAGQPPPASGVPAFPWESAAPHEPPPLDPAFDGGPQVAAEPPPAPMPWETARLPEIAPEAADAPSFSEPAPTQAMEQVGWREEPEPTQLILPPTETFGAAGAATELLGASPDAGNAPTSALDALFGENRFREYQEGADPSENPFVRKPEVATRATKAGGVGTTQKVLLWVAGGLVAAIALVALFLVGTRLPDLLGPAPAVTHSASPTPSPSPSVLPVGPVAPGTYAWDELLGGECLDPYDSPWAEEFTVVDCAAPHPAQMVFRGTFVLPDPTNEAYPGEDELQSQLALLCSAPGVINLAAAGQYADVQFQGSFPATQEQWDAGDRDYFCFVSRSSGDPLTGSVAVAQAPVAAPAG